ncbi:hypothetical protein [Novosphingobium sp. B 225]|uniref:hypothetical protein n=1 Tax=Novosphingobium sp. B 225 TaxID=1961849 RepID=UPI000B4B4B23|nr:hypothetical protein [Novosphingobium sp. B 225]
MTTFELLFLAGALGAALFMARMALARPGAGNWVIAALLAAAFFGYSLFPILIEGPTGFVANHTVNLWGVQVWYDLVFALGCAVFLAAPRARRVGMAFGPWLIPVLLLGSIGLFMLLARLFWLEQKSGSDG